MVSQFSKSVPVAPITVRVDSSGVHCVLTQKSYVMVQKDGSLVWSVGSAKASLWLLSRCVWTVVVCIV